MPVSPQSQSQSQPQPDRKPLHQPLDVYQGICGLIRAWMVSRDAILLDFLSSPDDPIPHSPGIEESKLDRMNELRRLAFQFAELIADADNTSKAIVVRACAEVLAIDRPKFVLYLPELPNSF